MSKTKDNLNTEDHAEATTQEIVARMTPLETGLSVYPTARPVPLRSVLEVVVRNHLVRYTYDEFDNSQFLEVLPGKSTFFMDHDSRKRRAQAKIHTELFG